MKTNWQDKFLNKITQGDCLKLMRELPDEWIDCVVTSPPYWGLRDYGYEGQLGLEPTFKDYIEKLCNIFDEVCRVLKKTGTCWVNIGDTYSGSWGDVSKEDACSRGNGIDSRQGLGQPQVRTDLPDKCLIGIPERFRLEMTDNHGWILRNTIIWQKPNCMPESVKDRFTVDFEYLYFFTKNGEYYFEQQLEPTITKNINVRDRDITKLNNVPGRSRMGGLNRNNYDYKNKRTVWDIPTRPFRGNHYATFPELLVETPIKAGCPEGGVVLDPFIGSGTTGLVAHKLHRNFIGFDLSQEYVVMANKRLSAHTRQGNFLRKEGRQCG